MYLLGFLELQTQMYLCILAAPLMFGFNFVKKNCGLYMDIYGKVFLFLFLLKPPHRVLRITLLLHKGQ